MELGAPSARNSCQISCALEGTSWSGRRLKSCTANQNLQQCHTQSITTSRKCVYSVNFTFFMTSFTLITHALFSLATKKHSSAFYSSSIMLLQHTRLQKNKPLQKSNNRDSYRRFSELNSDSRNFRNWSRPAGSFSASSREKPHFFTRCWVGSRLLTLKHIRKKQNKIE